MNMWQQLGMLLLVAAALIVSLIFMLARFRRDPDEQERRRRLAINARGRLGDAEIVDVHDESIVYSYSVGGVGYTAAQNVSRLKSYLPEQPERMIGPAMSKYAQGNPANSIVVCEQWSGLRVSTRVPTPPSKLS